MGLITDYDSLKSEVATWLNRSDLTANIPGFVQNAEAAFKRDRRVRKLVTRTLDAGAEDVDLPTDYQSMEALYHDGPTYFGELTKLNPGEGAQYRALYHGNSSGAPMRYAILDGKLRFFPVPDSTYTLKMAYWRKLVSLSGTPSNWLLEDHPDIYLYGSLVQAEPFLKNDSRIATWKTLLEEALAQLHLYTDQYHDSGHLVIRPSRPIG